MEIAKHRYVPAIHGRTDGPCLHCHLPFANPVHEAVGTMIHGTAKPTKTGR